ncbi:hypothetical protein [Schumannella sp. 10F1B-5-1]|uniref:hypothetical protein n=1 Tax=Schumannella sp. 10F1B-5-1 TaxID=2590780 RepID=UPI0011300C9D|nr:hypothetical protein [Schumannella sp. 10F1B-5-1]TPW78359.1 hypothetical protein FJ658_00700 [Schumannella sp. 10F1B-5-1]
MTDSTAGSSTLPPLAPALRRLYFIRFAFALIWAIGIFATGAAPGPVFTTLLIVYPLVDAAAVIWQLRSAPAGSSSKAAEWLNVVMSIVAAIGLGWASAVSVSAVLAVWGAWAVVSGIAQLLTALLRRRAGGQIPLVISGVISIPAGLGFFFQGIGGGTGAMGVGGYAILGGIFFLIAAIRLSLLLRKHA